MIYVTKRDGSREPLNIDKLHKVVFWATEGITGVSASEIEMKSHIQFYDGIKTTDIQETMIKAAANLITEDTPNYQYVAGRLINYHLRKIAYDQFEPLRLFDLVKRNVDLGFYDVDLLKLYSEAEWDQIESFVDHERDMSLTYAAMEQLRGKYLVQNRATKRHLETPQVLYILVSAVIFSGYPKEQRLRWVRNYYDAISQHDISLPTPIMAGVRTNVRQFSSCFPAGQMVQTATGYKAIENVVVGDLVMTRSGRLNPVLATREKINDKRFVGFTHNMFFDDSFTCTEDHLLWSIKRKHVQSLKNFDVAEWTEAANLENGDYVHIPVNRDVCPISHILVSDFVDLQASGYAIDEDDGTIKKLVMSPARYGGRIFSVRETPIPAKIALDEHFHRVVGYFLAEGHVIQDKCVTWTFGRGEKETWIADLKSYFETWGYEIKSDVRADNSITVSVHSKIFAQLFKNLFGSGATTKSLPDVFMRGTSTNQRSLLIGVIRGDGCVHRLGMSLALVNRNLISQIARIMIRVGLFPTLWVKYPSGVEWKGSTGRTAVKGITCRQVVYGINLARGPNQDFIESVGKRSGEFKHENLNKYSISKFMNGEFFTKIRKKWMSDSAPNTLVYDLQVDNDQSFTVANLSVHNCVLIEVSDDLKSINEASTSIVDYVSRRAGIGIGAGRIRGIGSPIRNGDATHTGVTSFYKLFQASVNSCNQGAIRKGSATLSYVGWHIEFEDIVVLKNNKGTEENRVRQLDYCVQLNKLFYERLMEKGDITFFCPNDVPEMYDAFFSDYEKFKTLYVAAEKNKKLRKKKMKALDFFSTLMSERKDTGRIYIMNVDNVNHQSPFDEKIYPIRMTNLCVEVTQATIPIGTKRTARMLATRDDLKVLFEQTDECKILGYDSDRDLFHVEMTDDLSRIALCTLSAINWGNVKQPSDFKRMCELAVRGLDAILDYQDYPMAASKKHTEEFRPLGVGIINLAYFLAKNGVKYGDEASLALVDEYAEAWSYYLIKASVELAKEKGACKNIDGVLYGRGLVPMDLRKPGVDTLIPHVERMDWKGLREDLKTWGIRNSTLMAQMPAETSAMIANATNGIEPPRALVSVKGSSMRQVVPEIRRLKNKYDLLWAQRTPEGYLKVCAILQKYIDQAISVNTSYNPEFYSEEKVPMSEMLRHLLLHYKWGGKTLYYFNNNDGSQELDVDKLAEPDCDSCKI